MFLSASIVVRLSPRVVEGRTTPNTRIPRSMPCWTRHAYLRPQGTARDLQPACRRSSATICHSCRCSRLQHRLWPQGQDPGIRAQHQHAQRSLERRRLVLELTRPAAARPVIGAGGDRPPVSCHSRKDWAMAAFLLKRFMQSIVLLVIVSVIGYVVLNLIPGGPLAQYALDPGMTEDDRNRIATQLGLNRPLWVQYFDWAWRLLQGDWGTSFRDSNPVVTIIARHVPATLLLMVNGNRHRCRSRHGDRHPRRDAPLFDIRLSGDGRRDGRSIDPNLLVRARRDLCFHAATGLAPRRQHVHHRRWIGSELPAPLDHAVGCLGARAHCHLEPVHADRHARRDEPGVRQDRSRQGTERASGSSGSMSSAMRSCR